MKEIKIGKIVNTFGIKGELKVISQSEFIEDRFKVGNVLLIESNQSFQEVIVESLRIHQGNVIIRLKGFPSINDVEIFKGLDIYIDKNMIPKLKDGYYLFDLEGLDVYLDGRRIGTVKKAEKLSSQTILRIQTEEKEVLIPFVDAFIKQVDLKVKRIDIQVIEGML